MIQIEKIEEWNSWTWQLRNKAMTPKDFARYLPESGLNPNEEGAWNFRQDLFKIQATPYSLSVIDRAHPDDRAALRKILIPQAEEFLNPEQMRFEDPLAEKRNSPVPRVIHRYSDRALLLVTDMCSVYCRYCTRKHFTGKDQVGLSSAELQNAISYFRSQPGLHEVILSGGDPLTLSDEKLTHILSELRTIPNVELIRIGTRMPVVCPMRITPELVAQLKKFRPLYMMLHFNHPAELTTDVCQALKMLNEAGIVLLNQMVLLKGVNNHPALVAALSRALLKNSVKPYYCFQCDPSPGTTHLRTTVEETIEIATQLWGHLSGLAMPTFSLDLPDGGGKVPLVPDFLVKKESGAWTYKGWDGIQSTYVNPPRDKDQEMSVNPQWLDIWEKIKKQKSISQVQVEHTS